MDTWKLFILSICAIQIYCYDDEVDAKASSGRCSSTWSNFKNGRAKVRAKGRFTKFVCNPGFDLVGKRFSNCVRGKWNNPSPVCVASGCNIVNQPLFGTYKSSYDGAYVVFDCLPGYSLEGLKFLYCNGYEWNSDEPICKPSIENPAFSCDFEESNICGWTDDPTDDFDWLRHNYETPSNHGGTGPGHDHTFGQDKGGFYMYIEASSPRAPGDKARLFSPVYSKRASPGCFTFWYHMYGQDMGSLRIYLKLDKYIFGEISPSLELSGNQGDEWHHKMLDVPKFNDDFQIIIEGVRGASYVSDIGIDDVKLWQINCQDVQIINHDDEAVTSESCRGRCREREESTEVCGCSDHCLGNNSCCSDFSKLCLSDKRFSWDNSKRVDEASVEPTTASVVAELQTTATTLVTLTTQIDIDNFLATAIMPENLTSFANNVETSNLSSVSDSDFTTKKPLTTALSSQIATVKTTLQTLPLTTKPPTTTTTTTTTTPTTTLISQSMVPATTSTFRTSTFSTTVRRMTTKSTTRMTTKKPVITTSNYYNSKPITTMRTIALTVPFKTTRTPTTKSVIIETTQPTTRITTKTTRSRIYVTTPLTKRTTSQLLNTTNVKPVMFSSTPKPSTNFIFTTEKKVGTENYPPTSVKFELSNTVTSSTPNQLTTVPTTKKKKINTQKVQILSSTSTKYYTPSKSTVFTTQPYVSTIEHNNNIIRNYSVTPKTNDVTNIPSTTTLTSTNTTRYHLRPRTSTTIATTTTTTMTPTTKTTRIYNLRPRSTTRSTEASTVRYRVFSTTSSTKTFIPLSTTKVSELSSTKPTLIMTETTNSDDYSHKTKLPLTTIKTDKFPDNDKGNTVHQVSNQPGTPVAVIIISVLFVFVFAGGIFYYLIKRKNVLQKHQSEDSDIRFLSQNEELEFSDASALDRLKFK